MKQKADKQLHYILMMLLVFVAFVVGLSIGSNTRCQHKESQVTELENTLKEMSSEKEELRSLLIQHHIITP